MNSAKPNPLSLSFATADRIRRVKLLGAIIGLLVFSPSASFSQAAGAANSDASFESSVQLFRSGKLGEARGGFLELEKRYPTDPTLLLNLGFIAQKENRKGAALGLWRKGLLNHPTHDELQASVNWLKPKLAKTDIARDIEPWEEFRQAFLLRVSPLGVIALSALFLLIAAWRFLRWWGARKRAYEEDLAMPPWPIAGAVTLTLFVFLFAVGLAFFVDRLDLRGTVLVEKIDVRSAPDQTATSLFEIFEGMEVIIRETRNVDGKTWRRVTYPGGKTGWVPQESIFATNDPSANAFLAKAEST